LQQQEMIEYFQKTLGEFALSNAPLYNWICEFKRDRTSTSDARHSDRPSEVKIIRNECIELKRDLC